MSVCYWNFFLLIKQIRGRREIPSMFLFVIQLRLSVSLGDRVWGMPWTDLDMSYYREGLSVLWGFPLLFPGPCLKSQLNIHIIPIALNVVVWSCNHKRKCFPRDQRDDSTQMYVQSHYPKNPGRGSKQEWADKEREALSCCGEFGLGWVKHVMKYHHPSFWLSRASSLTWPNWSRGDELVLMRIPPAWQCCVAAETSRGQLRNSLSRVPCSGLQDPSVLKLLPLADTVWRNWKFGAFGNCSHHLVLVPTFG